MTHSHITRAGSADPFSTFLKTVDQGLSARNGVGPATRVGRPAPGPDKTEAALLRALVDRPVQHRAQSNELGHQLNLSALQLAVLVARLEERGLVAVATEGSDEMVELTAAGRDAALADGRYAG